MTLRYFNFIIKVFKYFPLRLKKNTNNKLFIIINCYFLTIDINKFYLYTELSVLRILHQQILFSFIRNCKRKWKYNTIWKSRIANLVRALIVETFIKTQFSRCRFERCHVSQNFSRKTTPNTNIHIRVNIITKKCRIKTIWRFRKENSNCMC